MSFAAKVAERKADGPKKTFTILPTGTDNYTITGVKVDQNQNSKKYLVLDIASSSGSGQHKLWLQPMSDSERAYEVFESIIADFSVVFGLPEQATAENAAAYIAKAAMSFVGKTVEVFVKHEDYTWQNETRTRALTYLNKLVDTGPVDTSFDGNDLSDQFNATPISAQQVAATDYSNDPF